MFMPGDGVIGDGGGFKESAEEVTARGLKSFDRIVARANETNGEWAPTNRPDYFADAEQLRMLSRRERRAVYPRLAMIVASESAVDHLMLGILPAAANAGMAPDLLDAIRTQAVEEAIHAAKSREVLTKVVGVKPENIPQFVRKYHDPITKRAFEQFEEYINGLLESGTKEDIYLALFVYCRVCEYGVAQADVDLMRQSNRYEKMVVSRPSLGRIALERLGNKFTRLGERLPPKEDKTIELRGINQGQKIVRKDEGRHTQIGLLSTQRYLEEFPDSAPERIKQAMDYFLSTIDVVVKSVRARLGIAEKFLREGYGQEIGAVEYLDRNMARQIVGLKALGLDEAVELVRERHMEWRSLFFDDHGNRIHEEPSLAMLALLEGIMAWRRFSPR